MNKILHRTLTALVAIAAFAIPTVLLSRAGFPLFLIFLLATTISITLILYVQKIPMKCDQNGCKGTAVLEYNSGINNYLLKKLLIRGHKCKSCGHLIKPPKSNNS